MPDVKIKKSVLQNIIRKSLRESGPKGTHDVSQRLTIGPEHSTLPDMLPLSPSDRMSTQLDVERPPVEDPEYVPANSKELGFALQALAEMVPAEQVEQAYMAFQKIIERLEEEASDDEEVQLEAMQRKNRVLQALMNESDDETLSLGRKMGAGLNEAPKARLRGQGQSDKYNDDPEALAALERMKDYKPADTDRPPTNRKEQMAAFGRWLAKKGKTLAPSAAGRKRQFLSFLEDTKDLDAFHDATASDLRAIRDELGPEDDGAPDDSSKPSLPGVGIGTKIMMDYDDAITSFKISSRDLKMIMDLLDGRSITKDQLIKFMDTLDAFKNDKTMIAKVTKNIAAGRTHPDELASFIQRFSDESTSPANDEKEKDFTWRGHFKHYGYAAESGLRQAFIGDVNARFALRELILPKSDEEKVYEILSDVFDQAINDKFNKPLLETMFDEDALNEYTDWVDGADHEELLASELYRNFIGSINRDIMSTIADQSFVDKDKKDTRPIAQAFVVGFPQYSPLTDDEQKQLEAMAKGHVYLKQLELFLDGAEESNYRNTLAAAALLTAQEFDAREFGGYTIEPAFTSLKKHSGYKKPPEYALKDYIDADTPEGAKLLDDIKKKNKESEQLAKAAAASKAPAAPKNPIR